MEKVSTIGLDIAKSVFQVEGTNEAGEVSVRRQLRRPHLLKFFARSYHPAWWAWRRVPRRIIGRASSRLSGMRFA